MSAWFWLTPLPSISRRQLACDSWHLMQVESIKVLKDRTVGRTAGSMKRAFKKQASWAVHILSLSPIFLLFWKVDGTIDPAYFSSCCSMRFLRGGGGESTRRQFSIALKAAHCSWGVFTVCQQRCLAAVALCLHKCWVRWSKLVGVTADSTGGLTEKAHLLLNMHGGREHSGSLQLPACAHSESWSHCCLHTWRRMSSVCVCTDAEKITVFFIWIMLILYIFFAINVKQSSYKHWIFLNTLVKNSTLYVNHRL